jgi:hypothetical protein
VTSQQADPIAQRQAAQTTPPPKASDNLSNEDLAALTESWRHLAEAGDPRADKLRAYIGQQANSILHPEQQADPTGVIKKGWDWLSKGLISRDTMVGAISGMTPDQLDRAMSSYAGETPTHAAIREFTRGAIQDIGSLWVFFHLSALRGHHWRRCSLEPSSCGYLHSAWHYWSRRTRSEGSPRCCRRWLRSSGR